MLVRPSSVTDKYYTISGYEMLLQIFIAGGGIILPLKLSVNEDGLTAETGLETKFFLWNCNIINL